MFSGRHAVIVEDNNNNIMVLERLLAANGMTFTTIRQSKEVEEAIVSLDRIDVIFLDLEMPKMNGYEVFNVLKPQLGNTVPIIAYTVHTYEITNAREMGFDGFIGKPLDATEFPNQLSRILNGEPVWDTP